jgi:hypothetical protein
MRAAITLGCSRDEPVSNADFPRVRARVGDGAPALPQPRPAQGSSGGGGRYCGWVNGLRAEDPRREAGDKRGENRRRGGARDIEYRLLAPLPDR